MPAVTYQDLGNHIYCLDTGYHREQFDACYLVREGDALAFIDSGTNHSVPGLLEVVNALGLGPEHVRYVIPTHVHLDHAGGAGELMRLCPNATLVVHPKGAPHMIDPARLIAGATAVYGEAAFRTDYGTLVPVPAERVIAADDAYEIDLSGRILQFFDTPGHANHHGCIFDVRSRSLFTGDTFGISYREFDTPHGAWLFATTTPVAFDPEGWQNTLNKLQALNPSALLLTHYGQLTDIERLFNDLRGSVQAMADIALREETAAEDRLQRIQTGVADLLVGQAQAHGCTFAPDKIRHLLALDIELNGQGLEIWLQRRAKATRQAAH